MNFCKKILIFSVVILCFSCKTKKVTGDDIYEPSSNRTAHVYKKSIAIITNPHKAETKGGASVIEYYANNRLYVARGPNLGTLAKGEKFQMVYDSLNPEDFKVLTTKPVFLENEIIKLTIGTITSPKNRFSYFVQFVYTIGGKEYEKLQLFDDKIRFKKGEKFEVAYWEENPQRSIIHIDKPLK